MVAGNIIKISPSSSLRGKKKIRDELVEPLDMNKNWYNLYRLGHAEIMVSQNISARRKLSLTVVLAQNRLQIFIKFSDQNLKEDLYTIFDSR